MVVTWKVARKSSFFSGPATKAFSPPGLVAIETFFPYIRFLFFLSGTPI